MNRLARTSLSVLVALSAAAASAEMRTLEVVGTVPLGPKGPASVAPRDAAIDQALREAVVRVAQEFLADRVIAGPDSDELDRGLIEPATRDPQPGSGFDSGSEHPGGSSDATAADADLGPDAPDLAVILGKRMVPYTLRFRVIEDRGRRPALFAADPEVSEEYVVIVEVQVDVDRVQAKLVDAGLIPPGEITVGSNKVRLEIEGLTLYPAYLAMRELLEGALGATGVYPLEMERGRTVLEIETQTSAVEFLEQLLAVAPPELKIVPLHASGNRVHVIATWTAARELQPAVDSAGQGAAGPLDH